MDCFTWLFQALTCCCYLIIAVTVSSYILSMFYVTHYKNESMKITKEYICTYGVTEFTQHIQAISSYSINVIPPCFFPILTWCWLAVLETLESGKLWWFKCQFFYAYIPTDLTLPILLLLFWINGWGFSFPDCFYCIIGAGVRYF